MDQLVVTDLCWIRGRPGEGLPPGWTVVIPDGLFGEVATTHGAEPQARKLHRYLMRNRGRVFLGRNWGTITELERAQDWAQIPVDKVIAHQETRDLYQAIRRNGPGAWQLAMAALPSGTVNAVIEAKRGQFVRDAARFATLANEGYSDWGAAARSIETATEWVQRPERVAGTVAHLYPEFETHALKAKLNVFPDQLAVGRWFRLVAGVFMLRALGWTKRFENYWDDIQYAFLASYTKQLATTDRKLQTLCKMALPDVQIVADY